MNLANAKNITIVLLFGFMFGLLITTMSKSRAQDPPKNDFYQVEHLWRVKEVIAADSLEFKVYEVWRSNHWTILYVHKETGNMILE